jgi:chemotaxis signal transduction protein
VRVDRTFLAGDAEAAEELRYGFTLAQIGFLIGRRVVCEVIATPAVARIPHTPRWIAGVFSLRGSLVPLFELGALLDPVPDRQAPRTTLVLDRGEHAVGLVVAGLPQPLRALRALRELPAMPDWLRVHVSAALASSARVWLELDHRSLFESLTQQPSAARS